MESQAIQPRKDLSADGLIGVIRKSFESVADPRPGTVTISIKDALTSAYAMFSLKCASLLEFEERCKERNLQRIFGIDRVPSDTRMREILDRVDPTQIRPVFAAVFRCLQRGKLLERFVYWDGHYLLSIDGTQYFSSEKIHCECCLDKKSQSGKVTYSHSAVVAAIVHPDCRAVIPMCPEPIIRQDGNQKNDCERNATRRLLKQFRKDHPNLKLIVVEDGLSSNGPHIQDLWDHDMRFILGAKPGDHPFLFEQATQAIDEGRALTWETDDPKKKERKSYTAVADLSLNKSNLDVSVNFVSCTIEKGDESTTFSWVTDLPLTAKTTMLPLIEKGGRCRWKIENETFNTLKNQGYHFEHNYGHGNKFLSTVLLLLMMLAFLVDQVIQLACPLYRAALAAVKRKRHLWEIQRVYFQGMIFASMADLFNRIISDNVSNPASTAPLDST